MINTPTNLLAFLLALQSPQVGTLAKDSATKLRQLGTKLAVEPDDCKDIEGRLEKLSEANPALKTAYSDFQKKLQDANLTPEILLGLLPTEEEREVVSSSRKPVTFGPHPSEVDHPPEVDHPRENQEVRNVVEIVKTAEVAFKHEKPAQASKTLLQRLLQWFDDHGKHK